MSDIRADPPGKQGFKKERLSALQDGIFAVAMTLLALDLRIPEGLSQPEVHQRFLQLLPAIGVYATAFAIIAIVWMYVYSYQEIVPKQDIPAASLLLLACAFIVLVPFTSSSYARYYSEPLTVLAFATNILLIVLTYAVYVEYTARRLIPKTVDQSFLRTVKSLLWGEVAFGIVAAILCFWPWVALIWLAVGTAAAYLSLVVLHKRFVAAAAMAQATVSMTRRTVQMPPPAEETNIRHHV